MRIEAECDGKIDAARSALTAKKHAEAITRLDEALDMIRRNDFLASRKPRVYQQLGLVYLETQRPAEAVQAYQRRLEAQGKECAAKPGSKDYSSECAEGQQDLGIALIMAGKLDSAFVALQESAAGFEASAEKAEFVEIKMAYMKNLGESKMYGALALARNGKIDEAKSALDSAIGALTRVSENTEAQDSLRAAARQSLENAKRLQSGLR